MSRYLYDQPHLFHTLTVFCPGRNDINSCCVDTAVTENVGKLCNILFDAIKHTVFIRWFIFGQISSL